MRCSTSKALQVIASINICRGVVQLMCQHRASRACEHDESQAGLAASNLPCMSVEMIAAVVLHAANACSAPALVVAATRPLASGVAAACVLLVGVWLGGPIVCVMAW